MNNWHKWITPLAAIGGIIATWWFSRNNGTSNNLAVVPNTSSSAPANAPLSSGVTQTPLDIVLNGLPSNPFSQSIPSPTATIGQPRGANSGVFSLAPFYNPVQQFLGSTVRPQTASQPTNMIPPAAPGYLASGSPAGAGFVFNPNTLPVPLGSIANGVPASLPDANGSSGGNGCGCGGSCGGSRRTSGPGSSNGSQCNTCAANNCSGGRSQWPDGRGGCMSFNRRQLFQNTPPDIYLAWAQRLQQSGYSQFATIQQIAFDGDTDNPNVTLPAAPNSGWHYSAV
jgi:hypothetical protein